MSTKETENNRQDFERFAALYWGQDVVLYSKDKGYTRYLKSHVFTRICETKDDEEMLFQLHLRSIESLTDEELISVCRIGYPLCFMGRCDNHKWKVENGVKDFKSVSSKENDYSFEIDLVDMSIDLYDESELRSGLSQQNVIDYLRSIGILVPFMNYSVEDIIKMGWAVIKK